MSKTSKKIIAGVILAIICIMFQHYMVQAVDLNITDETSTDNTTNYDNTANTADNTTNNDNTTNTTDNTMNNETNTNTNSSSTETNYQTNSTTVSNMKDESGSLTLNTVLNILIIVIGILLILLAIAIIIKVK